MIETKRKCLEFLFDNYWSFEDLALHPKWKEAVQTNNVDLLEEILYYNGADLEFGWKIVDGECVSRITQRRTAGPRITFKERTDAYHMKNYMSVEDIITHHPDTQMRIDMIGIRNQTTSLQAATAEALGKYTASELHSVLTEKEEALEDELEALVESTEDDIEKEGVKNAD